MNLGVALSDVGEFDEALGWLRTSMRSRPDSPEAIDNLGMTLARQGKWDEAMRCYERALRLRPDFPEARRNRAYAWLARGDYERGWPEYEWRLRCRNHHGPAVNLPRWTGEGAGGASRSSCTPNKGSAIRCSSYALLPRSSVRGGRVISGLPEPVG